MRDLFSKLKQSVFINTCLSGTLCLKSIFSEKIDFILFVRTQQNKTTKMCNCLNYSVNISGSGSQKNV